jgi:hypothetical protein
MGWMSLSKVNFCSALPPAPSNKLAFQDDPAAQPVNIKTKKYFMVV